MATVWLTAGECIHACMYGWNHHGADSSIRACFSPPHLSSRHGTTAYVCLCMGGVGAGRVCVDACVAVYLHNVRRCA